MTFPFDEARLGFSNTDNSAILNIEIPKTGYAGPTHRNTLALRMKEGTSSRRANGIHHWTTQRSDSGAKF